VKVPGKDGKAKRETLDLDKHVEIIERSIKESPALKLLILDPLNAYFGTKADSFKAADVRRVLTPFAELAQRCKITILGVMHPPKIAASKAGSSVNRISGASAIGQIARSIWEIVDDAEDADWKEEGRLSPQRLFVCGKANLLPAAPKGLKFQIEASYVPSDDDPAGPPCQVSRVNFMGETEMAANEAWAALDKSLRDDEKDDRALLRSAAKSLIVSELQKQENHTMDWGDLQLIAQNAGFSRPTIFRAKKELNLHTERSGIYSRVRLPEGFAEFPLRDF
jgi:hypothetical protein